MGEIAEMMLDGTMCASCGVYLHDGHDGPGFPGYCRSCRREGFNVSTSVLPKRKQRRRRKPKPK